MFAVGIPVANVSTPPPMDSDSAGGEKADGLWWHGTLSVYEQNMELS